MINKKIILIFGSILILLVVGIIIFTLSGPSPSSSPTPSVSRLAPAKKLSPIQKVTIGKTTDKEIVQYLKPYQTDRLDDGSVRYILNDRATERPDLILTSDGVAVYERIRPSTNPTLAEYATVAKAKAQLGEPERLARGSKTFGDYLSYYIYASKGYAFIAHPFTGEIFEIQIFKPMSIPNYEKTYGQDMLNLQNDQIVY